MDNDIDSLLLKQFSAMATQDRDVLIAEFRRLLGNQLTEIACSFYLEMNNWCVYFAPCKVQLSWVTAEISGHCVKSTNLLGSGLGLQVLCNASTSAWIELRTFQFQCFLTQINSAVPTLLACY